MRRSFLLAAAAWLLMSNAGCFLPIYPSDPRDRMEALLANSENYRQIRDEWRRFWFIGEPSAMTYDRLSGNLQPP